MTYFYAKFDEMGRCLHVAKSPVDLGWDNPIGYDADPESIFLDIDDLIKKRLDINIVTDRYLFFSDGVDTPQIDGIPSDAMLSINGIAGYTAPSQDPIEVAIHTIGKYRSNIIYIKFDTRQNIENMLMEKVDNAAGMARKSFITDIPGQSNIYTQKRMEAERFLSHGIEGGPYMFVDSAEQANGIIAQAKACDNALSLIEATRLSAKQGIRSAENVLEMIDCSEIDWDALS